MSRYAENALLKGIYPKFNKGDNLRALCGSQMGNVGVVNKVVPIPGMETEYHLSFDCKPFDLVLTESKLRKAKNSDCDFIKNKELS